MIKVLTLIAQIVTLGLPWIIRGLKYARLYERALRRLHEALSAHSDLLDEIQLALADKRLTELEARMLLPKVRRAWATSEALVQAVDDALHGRVPPPKPLRNIDLPSP